MMWLHDIQSFCYIYIVGIAFTVVSSLVMESNPDWNIMINMPFKQMVDMSV